MSSPAELTAVVFDLDGLLFNTEDLYQRVGGEILRRRGHEFTQELLDAMMGRPGRVALSMMIDWHKLDATVEQLQEETDKIFSAILDQDLAPMPGALELLAALETAGVPKAIATSSRRSFLEDVLGRFDMLPRFQFTLTSEDVIHGKPHPEIYLTAAERLAIDPANMLVLEDSENGCRAAAAAGSFAVAVPGAHSRSHDFAGASLVIDDLHDARLWNLLQLSRNGI